MMFCRGCPISGSQALRAKSQEKAVVLRRKAVVLCRKTWRELQLPSLQDKRVFVSRIVAPEKRIGRAMGNLRGDLEGHPGGTSDSVSAAEQAIGQGESQEDDAPGKLMSAVGLILGTAVGPGILGLPAATLPAGLQASTGMILVAWAYVIASVLLVGELSCAVMAETGQKEVSFTGLVSHTLGYKGTCVVALVYASLNYALLVACISGLGSILQAPLMLLLPFPVPLLSAASAAVVGILVAFAPFQMIDAVNRGLCGLMIAAITSLVFLGVYAGRELLGAHKALNSVISFSSVLPAIPLTVLTLGFHVITPVVCGVVGGKPDEARRAILIGGAIPLAMVLVWNAMVLGLTPPNSTLLDPIKLLLSLSESAAPAVQAFAFAALGTTLIGYTLSFPKQLGDSLQLLRQNSDTNGGEKAEKVEKGMAEKGMTETQYLEALIWALAPPTAIAVFWPKAFTSALDFAGIYANCFLFGILPPVMAWAYRYCQTTEDTSPQRYDEPLLPGGKLPLLLLLAVSILLGLRLGES